MKSRFVILLFPAAIVLADTAGGAVQTAASHSWLTEVIKEQFPYHPPKPDEVIIINKVPFVGEIVVLRPFKVSGYSPRGIERALAEEHRRVSGEAFSWTKGGTIRKSVGKTVTFEVKPGFTPGRGFHFLSFSW